MLFERKLGTKKLVEESSQESSLTKVPSTSESVEYASFWRRAFAWLIDGSILLPIQSFLGLNAAVATANLWGIADPVAYFSAFLMVFSALILLPWFYFAFLESSRWQATPGKRLMGISVQSVNGERLSFTNSTWKLVLQILVLNIPAVVVMLIATGTYLLDMKIQSDSARWIYFVVSNCFVAACFFCCFFSEKRQTLFDLVSRRTVVRTPTESIWKKAIQEEVGVDRKLLCFSFVLPLFVTAVLALHQLTNIAGALSLVQQAVSLRSTGKNDQADAKTEAVSKTYPGIRYVIALIDNYFPLPDDPRLELEACNVAIKANYGHGNLERRGELNQSLGQYENAIQDFSAALKSEYSLGLYEKRAEVYLQVGQLEDALNDLNWALDGNRFNHQLYQKRYQLLLKMGRIIEARKDELILQQFDSQKLNELLAEWPLTDADELLNTSQQLIDAGKSTVLTNLVFALSSAGYFDGEEKIARKKRCLENALSLSRELTFTFVKPAGFYALHADLSEALGDFAQAKNDWYKVIQATDDELKQIDASQKSGKLAQRLTVITSVLDVDNQKSKAYATLARLHQDDGERKKALRCYEKALYLGANVTLGFDMADLLDKMGRTAEAERLYEQVHAKVEAEKSKRQ